MANAIGICKKNVKMKIVLWQIKMAQKSWQSKDI